MAKRFELHLTGMDMPAGLIDADHLVEIVSSLQEMAIRLGRTATNSAAKGRPSRNLDRVAGLRIGLEKGSTTIVAERDTAQGVLDFDLQDEQSVDRRFAELIASVGADERPDWVTDSLASTAARLVTALQRTGTTVEFRVDGTGLRTFQTGDLHRETWKASTPAESDGEVRFTGRLFAVNLHTHRLQVQDDVGNQVALPGVRDDVEIGRLVGEYVTVTGLAEVEDGGRTTKIHGASVVLASDPIRDQRTGASLSLTEILASAPGPTPGGIAGLTDSEIAAFLEATR